MQLDAVHTDSWNAVAVTSPRCHTVYIQEIHVWKCFLVQCIYFMKHIDILQLT